MGTTVSVTVLGPDRAEIDVILPANTPAGDLLGDLAGRLGLRSGPDVVLRDASGQAISPDRTLAAARVADGDYLTVEPATVKSGLFGRRQVAEPDHVTTGYRVLPCYLVIDTSGSMDGKPIDDVNAEIPRLYQKMLREPLLAEICHIAIVTFDSRARVHLPLTDINEASAPKPLRALGSSTNYASVFTLLRAQIADDVYRLRRTGRRPYRPVVFFLSDGLPYRSGDWRAPLAALADRTGFHCAPNLIAFGFGDADQQTITEVGRKAAYLASSGMPTARLDSFMVFLLSSLQMSVGDIGSGASDAGPDDILEVPAKAPSGWRALRVD